MEHCSEWCADMFNGHYIVCRAHIIMQKGFVDTYISKMGYK